MQDNFAIEIISQELDDSMLTNNTWHADCPVAINRLRLLKISYYDFDSNYQNDGEMIVLDAIADRTIDIFKKLYDIQFPIAKIKLINEYNGNDELSMADNNSSSFCNRQITGGGRASLHSYGVAIDINPVQNPYFKPKLDDYLLSPIEGAFYMNRANLRAGMVEPIVDIFTDAGFIWGGTWNDPIDWMHFQLDRDLTEKLASMESETAIAYFASI